MLQWMGGSRRKVTTSRKSTQKRQKQYFEQRKRQRQSSNTFEEAKKDGFACNQTPKENRSLDVLSLLHAPKDTVDSSSSLLDEVDGSPPLSSLAEIVPSVTASKLKPLTTHEAKETRYLSSEHTEAESPVSLMRSPLATSGSCEYMCEGVDDKLKNCKIASSYLFDLIGDDGTSESSEETVGLEAHVAFSIEGLGNVGTETPVHSPQQSFRLFSGGHASSEKKLFKHAKNILQNFEMEEEFQDIHMSYGNYLVSGASSQDMLNSVSCSNHQMSAVRDCMPLDIQTSRASSFGDHDSFDDILDKNGAFETVDPPFLDDDIFSKEYANPWDIDRPAEAEQFMEDDVYNFSFESWFTKEVHGKLHEISIHQAKNFYLITYLFLQLPREGS